MPDPIILERLQLVPDHAVSITKRVENTEDEQAFLKMKESEIIVDSRITRLQALSENVKKIQKLDALFFKESIPVDTSPIVRFRDLASHHYELFDNAAVLQICKTKVPLFANAGQTYLEKMKESGE